MAYGPVDDYPRDVAEFERRFATEAACRAYLLQLTWRHGFRCPRCGQSKALAGVGARAHALAGGELVVRRAPDGFGSDLLLETGEAPQA